MCSLGTLLLSPPDGQTKIDRHIFIFMNLFSSTYDSTPSHQPSSSSPWRSGICIWQGGYFSTRWSNQNRLTTYILLYKYLQRHHRYHLFRDMYLGSSGISPGADVMSSHTTNAYQLNNNYDRWWCSYWLIIFFASMIGYESNKGGG